MSTLLADWSAYAGAGRTSQIIPDGCRDIICLQRSGYAPFWFISPLQSGIHTSRLLASDKMTGFRLAPGVQIDEQALLENLKGCDPEPGLVRQFLDDFTHLSAQTQQAIACLSGAGLVAEAARDLGVGIRSLQRLIHAQTGQSPGFWLQLARIRNAGRLGAQEFELCEVAYQAGYADQSHMSRDFRRWFGTTPSQFLANPNLCAQLDASGFA